MPKIHIITENKALMESKNCHKAQKRPYTQQIFSSKALIQEENRIFVPQSVRKAYLIGINEALCSSCQTET